MKKYKVTVNRTVYEVELEALTEQAPAAAPASSPGTDVCAPIPGTVLEVSVQEGQQVKSGQVLMVLEAMKMEHEIMAPQDGRVISLPVGKDTRVEAGTLLCRMQ